MRIGIIAANNIRYSPYIFFYTELLRKLNVAYEVIIPDRNRLEESFGVPLHILPWRRRLPTVVNYSIYSGSVKKILKREAYDLLVVLTGNNAAFLGPWLKKHYSKRYIIDIRDYSHEDYPPYYSREKVAIENSLLNIISSLKFTRFLPASEYYVCHNCSDGIQIMNTFKRQEDTIRIGYVGSLSYVEQCIKMMKLVTDDPRFIFEFYGTSPVEQMMREKAKTFNCDRIIFHGGYIPEEKSTILRKVDILFNAYGNGCPLLDYALSNKLYDAYAYVKPILTSPGTYMSEMAGPLSFEMNFENKDLMNDLYSWYMHINPEKIEIFSKNKMHEIVQENENTKKRIEEVIVAGV